MDILNLDTKSFQLFLLVLARMGGIFTFAPLLGNQRVSPQIKGAFTLFLCILLFPVMSKSSIIIPSNIVDYFIILFKELALGFVIGFSASFIFAGIQLGGQFIGREINIDMGATFNPAADTNVTVIENFKMIFASLVFMSINGHHWLIKAFVSSYNVVTIGNINFNPVFANKFIALSSGVFIIAFKICAPLLVTSFIITVILGIMERVAGQLHIFSIGFILQMGVGLFMMTVMAPLYLVIFLKIFGQLNSNLDILLTALKT